MREGMWGNILSRGVVAFVTEIVACIEFESPFVSLTLTAKSWRRPGTSRFVRITLAWHTLLYNVHGRLSILTTGVMVAKQIKKLLYPIDTLFFLTRSIVANINRVKINIARLVVFTFSLFLFCHKVRAIYIALSQRDYRLFQKRAENLHPGQWLEDEKWPNPLQHQLELELIPYPWKYQSVDVHLSPTRKRIRNKSILCTILLQRAFWKQGNRGIFLFYK